MRLEQLNLRGGLRECCAGAHAANYRHVISGPVTVCVARIDFQGNPQVRLWRGKSKIRRHDTHDLALDAVEIYPLADYRKIGGKPLLPDAIAQENEVILGGEVLARAEGAAKSGRRTQDRKKIGGHKSRGDANGD